MFSNSKRIVSEFFGDRVGRFLEIGANELNLTSDSEPCSHLLEKGWYGLYCEPNPFSLAKLTKQLKVYNADIICAAVNSTPGIEKFYASESHSHFSSMDIKWVDKILQNIPDLQDNIPREDYTVYVNTITPTQIFDTFGYDFDCISIDIELPPWHTHEILKQIDFNKVSATMVIVETQFIRSDEYMRRFGFDVSVDGADRFYTR